MANRTPLVLIACSADYQTDHASQVARYIHSIGGQAQVLALGENVYDFVHTQLANQSVILLDGAFVAGETVLTGLALGEVTSYGVGVVTAEDTPWRREARVLHGQVISTATAFHRVSSATHSQVGIVRIPAGQEAQAIVAQARFFAEEFADTISPINLISTALVRSGHAVAAIRPFGFVQRCLTETELHDARATVLEQNEEQVQLEQSRRANDGFYSSFVLRRISPRLARFAISKKWTPNQITMASLALAAVVVALFAIGSTAALIAGGILLQVALLIDCIDGDVARYTGATSKLGAWLDASTDRVKEYGVYAGLAFGALNHGAMVWKLALLAMILQTVRHLNDYNFAAVQKVRETSSAKLSLDVPMDVFAPVPLAPTSLDVLKSKQYIHWLKKLVYFPIGERWLLISICAILGQVRLLFVLLITANILSFIYATAMRFRRARTWNHPQESSGCDIIEKQLDFSPVIAWMTSEHPHTMTHKYSWLVPSVWRLFEFGVVLLVAGNTGLGFLWVMIVAFHHYDSLYRALAGEEVPARINRAGLGFDGRTVLVLMAWLGVMLTLPILFTVGGIYLIWIFVIAASSQWVRRTLHSTY